MEEKVTILRHKIRSISHPEDVHNAFVTPDFTPIEQKRNKALREQLFNNDEKTENIYIAEAGLATSCTDNQLPNPHPMIPILVFFFF